MRQFKFPAVAERSQMDLRELERILAAGDRWYMANGEDMTCRQADTALRKIEDLAEYVQMRKEEERA